ncbi:MAG TPA: acyloxyacyl hydrolase [Phycisphaerales bacterium]|nr:acyloxyacyl hydrolase [Phycisphaerales bacterium]
MSSVKLACAAFVSIAVCGAVNAEEIEAVESAPFSEQASMDFHFTPTDCDGKDLNLAKADGEPVYSENAVDTALDAMSDNPQPFGTEGSWRINVQGGGGTQVQETSNWMAMGGVGLSYFMVQDLSIDFELNGWYFDEEHHNAVGGNFNLLFRWHFLSKDTWSIYGDAGAGIIVTSEHVPEGGSSFNFTPQAGVGCSFEVAPDVRAMVGIRWHHVSNASLYAHNPGRDNVLLYAGLSFPF